MLNVRVYVRVSLPYHVCKYAQMRVYTYHIIDGHSAAANAFDVGILHTSVIRKDVGC